MQDFLPLALCQNGAYCIAIKKTIISIFYHAFAQSFYKLHTQLFGQEPLFVKCHKNVYITIFFQRKTEILKPIPYIWT